MKGKLDEPLEVEIADKESRLVREVYRGNVLEIEGVRFPIDLIPIVINEINVIVGMDWLSLLAYPSTPIPHRLGR